ncbi:hypothetical protein DSCA_53460 [Desulfosarcina alkanivorans]|uniref:Uncharacterized protein n=1 Tax=Desulfosarcina alkanivorans TaxID=571177 RepID=A0A5K7YQ86_9BACT|nr:hypothetical protein [Desulfosarcina alkanivorans]BBO71416.1 hypothetical protein DSCA_53460 [Desulfosarcina alkanivorans]
MHKAKWSPLCNALNTYAESGKGPLDYVRSRSEILKTILFSRNILLPAPSLLCNPCVQDWLNDDPELIEFLLSTNKIVSVLDNDSKDFTSLFNWLYNRSSVSLRWVDDQIIENTAKYLDKMYASTMSHSTNFNHNTRFISLDQLSSRKTQLSLSFVNNIDRLVNGLEIFKDDLKQYALDELDRVGTLHGTWWNNLGKKIDKRLNAYDEILSEVGTMVFDFAYASCVGEIVAGHPYGQAPSRLVDVSKEFLPKNDFEIDFINEDTRDIDATILKDHVLVCITKEQFIILENETRTQKNIYLKAIDELMIMPSNENLMEAKSRLDEYVISLSLTLKDKDFGIVHLNKEKVRSADSSLKIWRSAETLFCSICVGAAACGLSKYISGSGSNIGLMLTFFASAITLPVKKYFSSKIKETQGILSERQRVLDYKRPISMSLRVKIPDDQGTKEK